MTIFAQNVNNVKHHILFLVEIKNIQIIKMSVDVNNDIKHTCGIPPTHTYTQNQPRNILETHKHENVPYIHRRPSRLKEQSTKIFSRVFLYSLLFTTQQNKTLDNS